MKIFVKDEELESQAIENIKKLFNGELKRVNFKNVVPNQMVELIAKAGGECLEDDLNINGWQYDYWIPVVFKDKEFMLFGTGYFGTASLFKDQ